MSPQMIFLTVVWAAAALAVIVLMWKLRRRKGRDGRRHRSGPGAGAMGAVYGMLSEDKRRAIEIIAEGRAEATDPETADGKPGDDGADVHDL